MVASQMQLTLEAATIATPFADPVLVRWLGASGLCPADSRKLAVFAAHRTQFMPADVKAAYVMQLTAARKVPDKQLLQRARGILRSEC